MNRRALLGSLLASPALALDARPSPGDVERAKVRERSMFPVRIVRAPAMHEAEARRLRDYLAEHEGQTFVLPSETRIEFVDESETADMIQGVLATRTVGLLGLALDVQPKPGDPAERPEPVAEVTQTPPWDAMLDGRLVLRRKERETDR